MVELFDEQRVSFVAVTQQFNTTTSMGRLTLNVLLSFAQFEREVIGERIRDKVAASKRKGMWMGGTRPFGYDVQERKLIVKQAEAGTIRHIFERYLELGQVRLLIVSHKRVRYQGQHEPILTRELWDRVQGRLHSQAARRGEGRKTEAPRSPLAGKLFDEAGEGLYVQGGSTDGRRYRYYVSKGLVRGESRDAEKAWRVSAPEIERVVCEAAGNLLSDHGAIAQALEESGIDGHRLRPALESAKEWVERLLPSGNEAASALAQVTERIELRGDGIRVALKLPISGGEQDDGTTTRHLPLNRFVPMHMKRRGVEMRFVLEGDSTTSRVDLPLLKAVARSRRWSQELISGRVQSVGELAKREGIDRRSVRRLLRLGFLSPRIVEAIVEGHQPPDLTVIGLTRRVDLPPLWRAQEHAVGLR